MVNDSSPKQSADLAPNTSGTHTPRTHTPRTHTPRTHTPETDAPGCDEYLVHLENVRQLQDGVLETDRAQHMAEFFSALSDPHRLKLLSALAQQELCVCDLAALVKMGESAVSHQLRVLRSHRLVRYRRQGRNVYYSLADNHIINLYREVAEHLNET